MKSYRAGHGLPVSVEVGDGNNSVADAEAAVSGISAKIDVDNQMGSPLCFTPESPLTKVQIRLFLYPC